MWGYFIRRSKDSTHSSSVLSLGSVNYCPDCPDKVSSPLTLSYKPKFIHLDSCAAIFYHKTDRSEACAGNCEFASLVIVWRNSMRIRRNKWNDLLREMWQPINDENALFLDHRNSLQYWVLASKCLEMSNAYSLRMRCHRMMIAEFLALSVHINNKLQ